MSRTLSVQFPLNAIDIPTTGTVWTWQAVAPTNSQPGWAQGALWMNTATGILYENTGSNTSSTWTTFGAAAGNTITTPTGSPGAVTTVQGAFNELYQNAITTLAFVPLTLPSWRAIASNDIPVAAGTPAAGILASDTAPKLKRVNTSTDKALKIEWAASSVIEITNEFYYPPDMDVTKNYTVNLAVKMASTNDTPTTTVNVFEGIGDTNRGGTTAAASSTLQQLSVTVTPTGAHPNFASISVTPGTHGTDTYQLYEAYILYQRKVLTS